MSVNFAGFVAYGRIPAAALDEDGEALVAELCLRAAVSHANSAGIPTDKLDAADNGKYELYIYALALHFYDNRGFLSSTQSYAGDEYTKRIMRQMRKELELEGLSDDS